MARKPKPTLLEIVKQNNVVALAAVAEPAAEATPVPAVAPVPAARSIPVGCPVQFILDRGPRSGEVRAAVVVRHNEDGSSNLQVFTDGDGNKRADCLPPVWWAQNVRESDGGEPGSYRALR